MNIIPEATVSGFLSGQASLPPEVIVTKALRAIRTHLQMDVAFVSEFLEGRRHFRQIDAQLHNCPIKIGNSDPLEESYCQRVVDGRLPELIHDATKVAAALELPVTRALPVGAHMSVPIVLNDGRVYGTLCCFSQKPDHSLNHRDLAMMRVFAEMAAEQIENQFQLEQSRIEIEDRINGAINENALSMVFQPIYRIAEKALVGFESLARFSVEPIRTPDKWFI